MEGLKGLRIATAIAIGDSYVDVMAGTSVKSNAWQSLKNSQSKMNSHTLPNLLGNTIDVKVR